MLAAVAALSMFGQADPTPLIHNYDLEKVSWRLSLSPDAGSIEGLVDNRLILNENTNTVQLHCGGLNVSSVTANGAVANFHRSGEKLTVDLPQLAKRGTRLDIRISYSGKPETGIHFVDSFNAYPSDSGMAYTQGEPMETRYWLPTYDYPDDPAVSECYVTVPKDWVAISNGRPINSTSGKQTSTFHYRMDQPHATYLNSILAGKYEAIKENWKGTPVDIWVPLGLKDKASSMLRAPQMLELFSRITRTPYPYPTLNVSTAPDFMESGMENAAAITLSQGALHSAEDEEFYSAEPLVAHEIAHQWFGDLVAVKSFEDQWLKEGFAELLNACWLRESKGKDAFDLGRLSDINFEIAYDRADSSSTSPDRAGSLKTVCVGNPYGGGVSRLYMLMHTLGESQFWKGVHEYLAVYRFRSAGTHDFFVSMSRSTGVDLSFFEREWFHTGAEMKAMNGENSSPKIFMPVLPEVTVSTKGSNLLIRQSRPAFDLKLKIAYWTGKRWRDRDVNLTSGNAKLALGDLAGKPYIVDPECWNVVQVHYADHFKPKDIVAMYKHGGSVVRKAKVAKDLFVDLTQKEREQITNEETNPLLINYLPTRTLEKAQIEARSPDNSRRMQAVNALAEIADPTAEEELLQISTTDPNEAVRTQALAMLVTRTKDSTLVERAWGTPSFNNSARVAALRWFARNNQDRARELALGIVSRPENEQLTFAAISVLGALGDKPGEHVVLDAVTRIAEGNSLRRRAIAINSLAVLGGRNSISFLQPLANHPCALIRDAARNSLARIHLLTK